MRKLFQKTLIAAALALPVLASAGAITMDMNGLGAGQTYTVDLLDWTAGNALAVNGNTANRTLIAGDQTQLLYQANLGIVSLGGVTQATAGSAGAQNFTVVAGFNEIVLGTSTPANINFGFNDTLVRDASNFFYIYANTFGNNLAGTGFVGGTLVMSGYISQVLSSNYATAGATGLFDLSPNGDQYAGKQTLIGSGASDINVTIDGYDTNYFRGLSVGEVIALSFTNTSVVTPFRQVDPSRFFSSNGLLDGNLASNIGTTNGIAGANTVNFQLQADGNSSFATTSVPEPGSLALVGLALGAVGFVGRRTSKKV